jgi:recombination protein RecR
MDTLETLIKILSRLPGLGPRSARRLALHLLKKKETLMIPLGEQILTTAEQVKTCSACGNIAMTDPCGICADARRDRRTICVVEDVDDLWAVERTDAYRGQYHVTGGTLSALDGIRPEDLRLPQLLERVLDPDQPVSEVILALSATVDGQATGYYISDQLKGTSVTVTRLAQGIPIGSELDYLDDGTLSLALQSRQEVA